MSSSNGITLHLWAGWECRMHLTALKLTTVYRQDDAGRHILAVGQPVVQRPRQLHKPQR